MKEKMNQMFKDKLFLVMLVLGLLTIVAAAGVVTIQKGNGQQQDNYLAQESIEESQLAIAGESNAMPAKPQETKAEAKETAKAAEPAAQPKKELAEESKSEQAALAGTGKDAAKALMLNFNDAATMLWPVRGNVLLDYDMESTIYFPTLDQYKCNPALVIQGQVGDPVYAPANAKVTEVGYNEEIGNFLKLDLGNEYTAICGQLKDVSAVNGEYLEQGQLMGYVAEPTKYYSVEGSNIFLEVLHQDATIDPLDYLD